MTKEEILEMYPVGTVINPVLASGRHSRSQYTVKEGIFLKGENCSSPPTWWYYDMTQAQYLVHNNRHSKIISKPAEATTEFKVGDKVTITKGTSSWNDSMDQYVGKTAVLVREIERGSSSFFKIDLDNGLWTWFPQYGHFVKYEEAKPAEDILKKGDTVCFTTPTGTLKYKVYPNFCELIDSCRPNDEIFKQLEVDKNILATECYGYEDLGSTWPQFKARDYAALTRLVNKLHELCAEASDKGAKIHLCPENIMGLRKEYWSNGNLCREYYVNDKGEKHGEYKHYHTNGKLYIHCFYKHGECHGEYKQYYDDGKLHTHCFYKDGELSTEAIKPKAEVTLNPRDLNTIKAKYSPGKIFIPIGFHSSSDRVTVQPDWIPYRDSHNCIYFMDAAGKRAHNGYVYQHVSSEFARIIGAEVISKPEAKPKPKVPTVEELKAMYPVGTKFRPINHDGSLSEISYIVSNNWKIFRFSEVGAAFFVYKVEGGDAHEGYLWNPDCPDKYAEIVSKPDVKPKPIFNIGDKVKVCDYREDNGAGWYIESCGSFRSIKVLSTDVGKVEKLLYIESKKEWYYQLSCHWPASHVAEHALTVLLEESKHSKGSSLETQSSTQQQSNSLNNNPYEKPIEHPKAVFLQRVDLQVRQGNPSRGVGLKSTVSQIRLGGNSCYYQERSSSS